MLIWKLEMIFVGEVHDTSHFLQTHNLNKEQPGHNNGNGVYYNIIHWWFQPQIWDLSAMLWIYLFLDIYICYIYNTTCSGGDWVLNHRLHHITSPPDLKCVVWASMQNQGGIFGTIRKFLDHDVFPKHSLRTNLWMYHLLAKCYWNIHWNDLLVSIRNDHWTRRSPLLLEFAEYADILNRFYSALQYVREGKKFIFSITLGKTTMCIPCPSVR